MLTKEQAEKILHSDKLKGVSKKNEIPKEWWQPMELEQVSDINGPFSSGCTGPEPHCRLVCAAVSNEFAATIVESGGFAYFIKLRLFEKKAGQITSVYTELIQEARLKELRELFKPKGANKSKSDNTSG